MSEDRDQLGDDGASDGPFLAAAASGVGGAESPSRDVQLGAPALYAPGNRVGRYRLLAPLASGGMAHVWAAKPEDAGFARTVALKMIRREYAADEQYVRMFVDEATVAASIHHPNVCETYELRREEGMLYMALEWVAGDSLAGLLHRDAGLEPLAEPLAARIIADVCAGLHAAHEAVDADGTALGIVHRDVSPPNILLGLGGQVKVSDFGIAKANYQSHSRTQSGGIKGRFAYLAPEQIGAKGIDRRADIFSLGCVLYVATLGLRPFGSGPSAMAKALSGEYKRPHSLVDGYPEALERIIIRCLQTSPDARYQTADEMRTELERWLLGQPYPVGTKELAGLVRERLDPNKRAVVEALLRSDQPLPDEMVYRLVRGEMEQTPTATSSVMFGPISNPMGGPVERRQAGRKPLVRFTALGRPIAPETPTLGSLGDDATDFTMPGTATRGERASPLLATTVRSHLRARGLRRNVWLAVLAILGIVLGWASCLLIPP